MSKSIKQIKSTISFITTTTTRRNFCTKKIGYTIINVEDESKIKVNNEISEIEKLRKKLLYQSKERGMLENDLLLGSFAKLNIQKLTESQLRDYNLLLQQPDPDIFNWILKKTEVPEEYETEVLKLVQHHCKNDPLGFTRK
ncbi:hypothetical protein RB653_003339 [Dictyostelium firmibasis]|uniref:Succinate dehydrogenase assembly factor 2, mitochondrial n=1 Tax=Dictyostelium firmibasis TaxID=79012 RepID=A0AAN7YVP4_9MYCE